VSLPHRKTSRYRRGLFVALFGLVQVRYARAEDAVNYKFQDYQESDGRIGVRVHSALIEKDLGATMNLRVNGVIDTIAGATPTGEPAATPDGQVPLAHLEEKRRAWALDFSKQFSAVKITLGTANSRESDYVSHVGSVNTQTDFNQKNTTVAVGVSGTSDDVKVFYQVPWVRKKMVDGIVGVTQVLDARTLVTVNLTASEAWGYLSDPYKLVEKKIEVVPGVFLRRTFSENRPDRRVKWIALIGLNRDYSNLNGALDASYRYHRDNYGITTHTLNVEWYQKFSEKFVLRPHLRIMTQSAADFYHVTLTGTDITPLSRPSGHASFYSSDYRLSALRTLNYGFKGGMEGE